MAGRKNAFLQFGLFRSLNRLRNQTGDGSFGEILRVTLPLVAATASHTILTFTDRVFLSWYSPTAIAAAVPASILSFTFTCFFLGTGQYVNVLIAQFFGAKQNEDLARSLWQGIYFTLLSAVIIILFIPLGFFIIEHSGHSPAVIAEEKAYFGILMFGGGFIVMGAVLSSFFSGRSLTKVVMYLSVMGAAINIVLNYVLIFGKLGFPGMGIRGAGIATITASGVVVFSYVVLILIGKDRHQFPVTRLIGFNKRIFLKLIRFGVPNGFQFFIDLATFSAFIFLIGLQGDAILAASNIVLSVNMLAFMPMLGIGQATSILVGQYMGRKKPDIGISVTYRSLKLAV
ncbi:MAG: MATE family efflux transporter, partial [Proteobacteria bacterium]|nr:MATE family efflux transporter [Pseudomonadota bacterium]